MADDYRDARKDRKPQQHASRARRFACFVIKEDKPDGRRDQIHKLYEVNHEGPTPKGCAHLADRRPAARF
jgi:hypothetical protein